MRPGRRAARTAEQAVRVEAALDAVRASRAGMRLRVPGRPPPDNRGLCGPRNAAIAAAAAAGATLHEIAETAFLSRYRVYRIVRQAREHATPLPTPTDPHTP